MEDINPEDLGLILEFYRELGIETVPVDESGSGQATVNDTPPEKGGALDDLRLNVIGDCRRCRLSGERKNIVFGEGNPDCEIMFIGEGPGEEEDIQGRPFVGRAGEVLTSLIDKMGFRRNEVYIANVVKCRPPGNRNPRPDEISACIPFLREQIRIIQPRVIMALGNVPLQSLIGEDLRISRVRGRFFEYEGIRVMPTFHPSYLLRNRKDKWLTWADAVAVLKYLGRDVKHGSGRPSRPD